MELAVGGVGIDGVEGLLALGQPFSNTVIAAVATAPSSRSERPPLAGCAAHARGGKLAGLPVAFSGKFPVRLALVGIAPPYVFYQYRLAILEARTVL